MRVRVNPNATFGELWRKCASGRWKLTVIKTFRFERLVEKLPLRRALTDAISR